MSLGMLSPSAAACSDLAATLSGRGAPEDVVEIGLLLPASWATALMELSTKRQESVGQLLRSVIGQALVDNDAIG